MAGLGGSPSITLDDPITSIFLVLFIIGAALHMTILQINQRRGKKFLMSGMLFGFCMARTVTCTMRLVWSTHLHNVSVAIAAQIFVQAGVLLLFIINLIFAQRILRASHPHWAWTKWVSWAFKIYYASIVALLVALITCTVQSFYTLDMNIRRIDRDVQLVGTTYFAVAAFLPIPLVFLRVILPKKVEHVDKFGEGRFRTKIRVLLFSTFMLTLGAAFRAGTSYLPRPQSNPAWYHSKACFYIFNFTIEIIVVYLYAYIRVDKRFIIPNGAHGPGSYGAGQQEKKEVSSILDRVNSEEEVFDGEVPAGNGEKSDDLEAARPMAGTEKTEDLQPPTIPAPAMKKTEDIETAKTTAPTATA
jgi:hypothetical protein